MNIYRYTFAATCPSDGDTIIYSLEICSLAVGMVEHIRTATALIKSGYHERIADELAERLGGDQTIKPVHQGVEIKQDRATFAHPDGGWWREKCPRGTD